MKHFAKKTGLISAAISIFPKRFDWGSSESDKGITVKRFPPLLEIEPRFSIDKLTGADLSFGPFKEWYFASNYIVWAR